MQRIFYAIGKAIEDTRRKKGDPSWQPSGLSIEKSTQGEDMADQNNTWIIKTLVGFVWVAIFTGLTMLTNGVIANENRSNKSDNEIRKDMVSADKDLRECIDQKMAEMKDDLEGIRTEQMAMREAQSDIKVTQMKVLTIVERLDKQLEKVVFPQPRHDPI